MRSLYATFYFENFITYYPIKAREADGALEARYSMLWTDGPLAMYSVADTGAFALAALKIPESYIGKEMGMSAGIFTAREVAGTIAKVAGRKVDVVDVSKEAFDGMRAYIPEPYDNLWDKCVCHVLYTIPIRSLRVNKSHRFIRL